jgi:plastin-1
LNSTNCNKESGLKAEGAERAKIIISHSAKLGVPKCIKPSEITNGITKLNLLFTAHIFNNCPGLTPNE